jgi:Transglycosylase SLT domain
LATDQRYLYEDTARDIASQYGIPADVFVSMIGKESGWNPDAHAPGSTASGLTQMIDGTARAMGADKSNPRSQMEGGAKYLRQQYDQFGSWDKALAAYNQGPGAANTPAGQKYARNVMGGAGGGGDAVQELMNLPDVGSGGGAQHPPGVKALLDLPDVQTPADTSDPEGNKDARDIQASPEHQRQVDIAAAQPGWLTRLKASNPGLGRMAGAAVGPFTQPPQQGQATARGLVTGGLGAVGNLEDFGTNTVPNFARRMVGQPDGSQERTLFPTSDTVSHVLDNVGWKSNPAWADYEEGANIGAQMLMPGAKAIESGAGLSVDAGRALERYGQGGAATDTLRRMSKDMQGRVESAVQPRVGVEVPAPRPGQAIEGLPGARAGQAAAPTDVNTQLRQRIADEAKRVSDAKTTTRADYETALDAEYAGGRPKLDLSDFHDALTERIRMATGDSKKALRSFANDVHEAEADAQTPKELFEKMDELRRNVMKKAKFGENPTGYDAILPKTAKDVSRDMKTLMDQSPAYKAYTKQYADLSRESADAGANFLSKAGEKEGSTDFMGAALRSPDNIDRAIKASGGDAKAFDQLAAQHVVRDIKDLSPEKLATWVSDNKPMLDKLPETRQAVTKFGQQLDRTTMQDGLAKKLAAQGVTDADRVHAYDGYAQVLQNTPAQKQGPILQQMAKRMYEQDHLLTKEEYGAYIANLEKASAQANRFQAMRNLSKYLGYALTGQYMLSFGGPAIVDAAIAAKALK